MAVTVRRRAPRAGETGTQVEFVADGVVVRTVDDAAFVGGRTEAKDVAEAEADADRLRARATRAEWDAVADRQSRPVPARDAQGFRAPRSRP